jgi:4-oxalomesaconate hydratase
MTKKILIVGAHSADFVWRAAGTIATITSQGGSASVIALSYGERGESGELWKEPNQTVENVKRIRHEEAKTAAEAVGAEFRCLDLGDYPLNMTDAGVKQLIGIFQDFQPNIVLTHNPVDPFNPDSYRLARALPAHSVASYHPICISSSPINLSFVTSSPMCSWISHP